ncbi:MAG: hypothetical protein IKL43_06880 [Alistipes sp.]|nr:hypothetical protein [Alistipes sp.]
MKFINIPKNGASWGGELCYSFATELDQPSDVQVIVRDADTNEEFGRMRLYSVIGGTVDIAPAVRRKMSHEPPSSATPQIVPSRAMCRVIVEVEGVRSPTITLFRASYNPLVHSVLSSMSTECGIALGDTLRFTLNVVKSATITVVELTGLRPRQIANLSYSAQSQVVEAVVPITNLSKEADKVVVTITNGIATDRAEYRIVERTEGSRKLLWYNAYGGIESYIFPYSRLLERKADVSTIRTATKLHARLNSALSRVRLTSAVLQLREQERIAELLRSPYIFEECSNAIRSVDLASRELRYDDHGTLNRLSLDIVEEWKGGGL